MNECIPLQTELIFRVRMSKRERIERMFTNSIGQRFGSDFLHAQYGSSFRSRVSEINRDPASSIRIKNKTTLEHGVECSEYWSERKVSTE